MKDATVKKLLTLCLYLGRLFAGVRSPIALAQTPYCNSQNTAPVGNDGWPHGQSVPVYIDPGLQGQRRSAVVQAFNNWTYSEGSNGSGVVFTFVSSPPPAGTGYTVLNQQHPSGNRETTVTMTNDTTGDTMSGTTYLSPTMTHPPASELHTLPAFNVAALHLRHVARFAASLERSGPGRAASASHN